MAEIVEFRTEEMMPELESMLKLLFEKDEIQSLHNMRKDYEYKILRQSKRKDDFINYINFETKFLRMLKLRYKKKGTQKAKIAKLSNIEHAVGKRLNRLFVLSIRSFSGDLRLWMAYVKFCQQMRLNSTASRVMEQMLNKHGHSKPELYKLAATFELEDCNDIEKARKYLLMGIHIHKDNKSLLTEAFRLELIDADRKRKELEDKNMPVDSSNTHLSAKKAENIYESSIKKLNDVELMNDLMNICAEYSFAQALQNTILTDLFQHDRDERMWDIVATWELKHSDDKLTPKAKIQKCVTLYETAVARLNSNKMWEYYLDALIEMNTDTFVLPNYKRKLLQSALQKASSFGKLTEKYYLIWVGILQAEEKHKKLVEVLQGAVKQLPDSVTLWHTLLKVHLTKGEEKQASQMFEQGVAALGKNSLPLWKLMLLVEQIKRNNKVEELFKKSLTQCPEISGELKPMYLEWLVLTHGIAVARKTYDQMCEMHPCLEMHKKMVYLESIQPSLNLKRIRHCYTIACAQFGDTEVDVWLDYYNFEMNHGEMPKVSEIYWSARKNLSPQVFERFASELVISSSQSPKAIKEATFKC